VGEKRALTRDERGRIVIKNKKGEVLPIPRGLIIREFKTGAVFQIAFSYRGRQCRELLKNVELTEQGLAFAERQLNSLRIALANETFDYAEWFPESPVRKRLVSSSGKTKFRDFAEKFVDTYWDSKEESTQAGYNTWLRNRILPELGDFRLGDITREVVIDFLRSQAKVIQLKSLRNLGSVLRMILAEAAMRGLIDSNPLAIGTIKLKDLSPKEMQGEEEAAVIDPFTLDEMDLIVAAAEGQMRNLIQVWRWCGPRTSELIAWRWKDIDFEKRIAWVRVAFVRGNEKGPKTKKGRRPIELCDEAIAALREQHARTGKNENGRVFVDERTGLPLTASNDIYDEWIKVIRKAGVRYRRPYQCRHSYASTMLTAGGNPSWLADQLGHEDVSTLYKHYGKYMRENVGHTVDTIAAKARALQAGRHGEVPAAHSDSHVIHTDGENA
jgi:integrase